MPPLPPAKTLIPLIVTLCTLAGVESWHPETQMRIKERWRFDASRVSNASQVVQALPPRNSSQHQAPMRFSRSRSFAFVPPSLQGRPRAQSPPLAARISTHTHDPSDDDVTDLTRLFRKFITLRGKAAHAQPCVRDEDCGEGMRCRFTKYGGYCALNTSEAWLLGE